ncbi:uncharacterized protein LOC136091133 [Hydra vulgaris]|uniref:Uncharacterized protein LOC136091133 n=1 Tax=Hydra vulgaris TaxID=6087 RepID=A0ABM4DI61_HYDVU
MTPSEFQRTATKLDDLLYFKAVEFRFFLLYSGLVVLKGKISGKEYNLFLALSIATRILLSNVFCKQKRYVIFSKKLFIWFTNEAVILYGETFSSYNVHSLIHIADDVLNHNKSLNELSAYPFEN